MVTDAERASSDNAPPESQGVIVYVETAAGRIPLDLSGSVTFNAATKIDGLETASIDAIYSRREAKIDANGVSMLSLYCTGDAPDYDRSVVYKLFDADGVIRYSSDLYFVDGEAEQQLFIFSPLEPGEYTLRFEELE